MTTPIQVQVKTSYLEEQSEPQAPRYVYGYTITLTNSGHESAQLLSRHWIITDAQGAVQEVQGEGVVGEKPRLDPGTSYTYTSGVVLPTETGTMTGSYQMQTDTGECFDAEIPEFVLLPPKAIH